jgi:nucleotide-binding universal stress UspA family protein
VSGIRRAVVGASGSPGRLRALRCAQELARAHNATLIPVLAWVPPGGDLADRRSPCVATCAATGRKMPIRACGMRSPRRGAEFPLTHQSSPPGERREAGWVLVSIASPGDLLVAVAGHRRALARVVCGKVSRYCLAHARCPVLAVPPPALPQEMNHGLLGWVFWHRPLTPDQIRQDRSKAAA